MIHFLCEFDRKLSERWKVNTAKSLLCYFRPFIKTITAFPECSIAPILPLWATGLNECTQTSDYVAGSCYQSRTFIRADNKTTARFWFSRYLNPHESVFTSNSCSNFFSNPPVVCCSALSGREMQDGMSA